METQNKYSKEYLESFVKEFVEQNGRAPRVIDLPVTRAVIVRLYGGYQQMLQQMKIESSRRKRNRPERRECAHVHCKNIFTSKAYKDNTYRLFCSVQCSNRSRSNGDTKSPRMTRKEWRERLRRESEKRLKDTPFDELGWDTQRKVVIQEQDGSCGHCSLDKWMGSPLALEIDHIDGDRFNNVRDNLIGLCPNCHSLTATWRGRNKVDDKKHVSDQELHDALNSSKNIRQALIKVGLAPKGTNYRRAKRLKEQL